MKRFLAIIAVFIFAVAGLAFYMYSGPHKNIAEIEPYAFISSEELFDEFVNDPLNTNKKYRNKVLVVNGIIERMSVDPNGELNVILSTGDIFGISCFFPKEQYTINELEEGMAVKIKGIFKGYLGDDVMPGDVVLFQCEFK